MVEDEEDDSTMQSDYLEVVLKTLEARWFIVTKW